MESRKRAAMKAPGSWTRLLLRIYFLVLVLLAVLVAGLAYHRFKPAQTGPDATDDTHPPSSTTNGDGPERLPQHDESATVPGTTEKWSPPTFADRQNERDKMVKMIGYYGLSDKAVLKAMSRVPRHEFVPEKYSSLAYADSPLPIGYGQTISQPYMVAEMTRQLKLRPESKVLEIGTGSGYQAAVLTEFTPHVYSIEIVEQLARTAAEKLESLEYDVVNTRTGDGYYGWPGDVRFDAIIVTCAAGQIPPPLLKQLAPGGRMVIPVGGAFAIQSLMLVTKDEDGTVRSTTLMPVRFVPLVRKEEE